MNKLITLFSAAALAFSMTVNGEEAAGDKPGVEVTGLTTISATVEAVDHENRLVTLRGPEGNQVTLEVSEEARNLPQVEVGDVVEVEYYESVAIFTREAQGDLEPEAAVAAARTPLGDKPGAAMSETVTVKAVVEAIDYDTRMVTLKGADGTTTVRHVDDSVKRLNEVKQGDEVVVRYTTAFAITVREP